MGVMFDVGCWRMKHQAPPDAVSKARRLRANMTHAEHVVWRLLRASFPDWHFRRQVPIRHFITDFASHRAHLVIEVDGGQHAQVHDDARTKVIEAEGYRVVRFWNSEVLGNPEGVHWAIAAALLDPHPLPSPPPSRGRE